MLFTFKASIFYLATIYNIANSAKILMVFPYHSLSKSRFVQPYIERLATQGHEITVISGFGDVETIQNTRLIIVQELVSVYEDIHKKYEFSFSKWDEADALSEFFYELSKTIIQNAEVHALMESKEKFDLVITEVTHADALFGFAQHFRTPLMGLSVCGSSWDIDYIVGNAAPSFYEPISHIGYATGIGLLERLKNWNFIIEEKLLKQFLYSSKQAKAYNKHFPNAIVPLHELRRNFSLVLINQHFTMGRPRSNVPNIIEVAGMHIPEHIQPLSAELETFINEAQHGVVYFSFGYDLPSTLYPEVTLQEFARAFRALKQRVVWNFDGKHLANKSDNVYISNWLPQMAILAHSNVRLFITHICATSLIETIHFGKPVLSIPLAHDQFLNFARLNQLGIGENFNFRELRAEPLTNAINKLLKDSKYMKQAHVLSKRFRDQPMTPLSTAVWWTEYVIRHKGAPYMRINEQDIAIVQYYDLDAVAVILCRLGFTLLIVFFLAYKMYNRIWCAPSHIGLNVYFL